MDNAYIDVKKLKSSPEFYRDKVKLIRWPDDKYCKHPSDFFRRNCLARVGDIRIKEVADRLGVTPKHLSSFLNEEVRIDTSLAVKLAKSTGFCEGTWLELQRKYDLYLSINIEPKLS
jgi:addiction module HigA family antidote